MPKIKFRVKPIIKVPRRELSSFKNEQLKKLSRRQSLIEKAFNENRIPNEKREFFLQLLKETILQRQNLIGEMYPGHNPLEETLKQIQERINENSLEKKQINDELNKRSLLRRASDKIFQKDRLVEYEQEELGFERQMLEKERLKRSRLERDRLVINKDLERMTRFFRENNVPKDIVEYLGKYIELFKNERYVLFNSKVNYLFELIINKFKLHLMPLDLRLKVMDLLENNKLAEAFSLIKKERFNLAKEGNELARAKSEIAKKRIALQNQEIERNFKPEIPNKESQRILKKYQIDKNSIAYKNLQYYDPKLLNLALNDLINIGFRVKTLKKLEFFVLNIGKIKYIFSRSILFKTFFDVITNNNFSRFIVSNEIFSKFLDLYLFSLKRGIVFEKYFGDALLRVVKKVDLDFNFENLLDYLVNRITYKPERLVNDILEIKDLIKIKDIKSINLNLELILNLSKDNFFILDYLGEFIHNKNFLNTKNLDATTKIFLEFAKNFSKYEFKTYFNPLILEIVNSENDLRLLLPKIMEISEIYSRFGNAFYWMKDLSVEDMKKFRNINIFIKLLDHLGKFSDINKFDYVSVFLYTLPDLFKIYRTEYLEHIFTLFDKFGNEPYQIEDYFKNIFVNTSKFCYDLDSLLRVNKKIISVFDKSKDESLYVFFRNQGFIKNESFFNAFWEIFKDPEKQGALNLLNAYSKFINSEESLTRIANILVDFASKLDPLNNGFKSYLLVLNENINSEKELREYMDILLNLDKEYSLDVAVSKDILQIINRCHFVKIKEDFVRVFKKMVNFVENINPKFFLNPSLFVNFTLNSEEILDILLKHIKKVFDNVVNEEYPAFLFGHSISNLSPEHLDLFLDASFNLHLKSQSRKIFDIIRAKLTDPDGIYKNKIFNLLKNKEFNWYHFISLQFNNLEISESVENLLKQDKVSRNRENVKTIFKLINLQKIISHHNLIDLFANMNRNNFKDLINALELAIELGLDLRIVNNQTNPKEFIELLRAEIVNKAQDLSINLDFGNIDRFSGDISNWMSYILRHKAYMNTKVLIEAINSYIRGKWKEFRYSDLVKEFKKRFGKKGIELVDEWQKDTILKSGSISTNKSLSEIVSEMNSIIDNIILPHLKLNPTINGILENDLEVIEKILKYSKDKDSANKNIKDLRVLIEELVKLKENNMSLEVLKDKALGIIDRFKTITNNLNINANQLLKDFKSLNLFESNNSRAREIIDTDDLLDLFYCGKVDNATSCQAFDYSATNLSQGLAGYVELPWVRLVGIKSSPKSYLARYIVKLGFYHGKPTIFLEPFYGDSRYKEQLLKVIYDKAKRMGVNVMELEKKDHRRISFPKSGRSFKVYSDALGGLKQHRGY